MFCLRRFIIAIITIFGNGFLLSQIFIYTYSSLITAGYFINYRPMNLKTLNRIEIINEIFVLPTCYFMILSTERIPDVELRYQIGKGYIYMLIFILSINFLMIVQEMFSQIIDKRKKN